MAVVFCYGLYPNRFIVENKIEKCIWVYPMKISWGFQKRKKASGLCREILYRNKKEVEGAQNEQG